MTIEKKISIEDIISWAKPHANKMDGAKHTVIETDKLIISIVGGSRGLYGDFVEDFEICILDKLNRDFMTKFFFPDSNDDVLAYQNREQVEGILKLVVSNNNFQVK